MLQILLASFSESHIGQHPILHRERGSEALCDIKDFMGRGAGTRKFLCKKSSLLVQGWLLHVFFFSFKILFVFRQRRREE